MVVLAVAMVIGLVRMAIGTADGTGTLVNTVWVIYDLIVLSVILQAAFYRGPRRQDNTPPTAAHRRLVVEAVAISPMPIK